MENLKHEGRAYLKATWLLSDGVWINPRKSDYIEFKKEEIKIENTNAFPSKAYVNVGM